METGETGEAGVINPSQQWQQSGRCELSDQRAGLSLCLPVVVTDQQEDIVTPTVTSLVTCLLSPLSSALSSVHHGWR